MGVREEKKEGGNRDNDLVKVNPVSFIWSVMIGSPLGWLASTAGS